MTTEASPKPPPDGRFRPTVSTNSSALLSQLSFIAESPNENDTELTEISHSLRFETDCNIPVLTILQRFIEQVLLLDNNAYLLSKDKKRHFVSVADIPTTPTELQQTFPATILNRRSGNRLVLRITMCCTKSFLELTQLGLVTWANRNKFRLETDIYNEDDVRDCLWIAGRDSKTSKPHLHSYLSEILSQANFDNDEQTLLNKYRTKHNLDDMEIPPFSIYWRNSVTYDKLTTRALIVRCDATVQKFFVQFLTRSNKSGLIPEKKGRFIPLSVSKNNAVATKRAMDGQNKYLTNTVSIPIIGLSFEALKTEIEVGNSGRATIESLIYQCCLSLEPTAKSTELGRFNLICPNTDRDTLLEFIKQDLPVMWTLLPTPVANKFYDTLGISFPRLTAGFSGQPSNNGNNSSITLDDPQSIGSNQTPDTIWTQPPAINRPPRYVSVIYRAESPPPTPAFLPKNKHKESSDKSHTTQSESDFSTLVSSIREEVNKELQAQTEIISALKEEITQLRKQPAPINNTQDNTSINPAVEHLRQEILELRQAIVPHRPPIEDFSNLITSIVENMVPLITAAVRQGLERNPPEPSKRSRHGATPTNFRTTDIRPTNLLDSFTPTTTTPDDLLAQPLSHNYPDNPDPSSPIISPARQSEYMEE